MYFYIFSIQWLNVFIKTNTIIYFYSLTINLFDARKYQLYIIFFWKSKLKWADKNRLKLIFFELKNLSVRSQNYVISLKILQTEIENCIFLG